MGLSTMEIGLKTRLKGMEHTHGSMADSILVHGGITICMDLELILGKMVESMKVTMNKTKNMVTVFINGLMVEDMKETGIMENNTAKENTYCQINH